MKTLSRTLLMGLLTSTVLSFPVLATDNSAAPADVNMDDLYSMPVEKLVGLDYTVTSASKREEKLLDTAAAIYVVSQEDIRRSGATSIPEALRGVPGLDVAQLNDHDWAVSARGFNGQFSNKLLVMIDGRSIYTPEFSGVLWDQENIPLENIERIEVIRGPGATLWGANAVNGVINIITKNTRDMQGNLVSGSLGTINDGAATVRHGGKIGDSGYYTVYANTNNDVNHEPYNKVSSNFSSHMSHAGFKTDLEPGTHDKVIVEGDLYDGNDHSLNTNNPFEVSSYTKGANFLGKWTHDFSAASQLQLQSYVDIENADYNAAAFRNTTYDLDVQHTYTGFNRHEIVWGAGARFINIDASTNTGYFPSITFDSNDHLLHVLNAFVQDQYALIPNKWFLTLGSKIEDNSYTGVEIEPSIRTLWKIDSTQSAWASVTRAIRTPSALENNFNLNAGVLPPAPGSLIPLPTLIALKGNTDIESEQLFSYEIGYRKEISPKANIDTTAFYNSYGNLASSISNGNPSVIPPGYLVVPEEFVNELHAKTWGAEIAPSWEVTKDWTLKGSYSFLMMTYAGNEPTTYPETTEQASPRHQFSITSYLKLPHSIEFDNTVGYTDALRDLDVPAFFSLNSRLGWKPFDDDSLELSLTGRNLFNHEHVEFNTIFAQTSQTSVPIPQDIIAKATLKF